MINLDVLDYLNKLTNDGKTSLAKHTDKRDILYLLSLEKNKEIQENLLINPNIPQDILKNSINTLNFLYK